MKTARQEAHDEIKQCLPKLQQRIYSALEEPRAINGIKDVIRLRYGHDYAYSTITARLSELEGEGIIYKTKDKLDGQSVFARSHPAEVQFFKMIVRKDRFEAWLREGEKFEDLMKPILKTAVSLSIRNITQQ